MRKKLATNRYSRRKRRELSRKFKIFIGIIIMLTIPTVGFLTYVFFTTPPIIELDEEPNVNKEIWMTFLPQDLLHFRMINFIEINKTSEGYKLFNDKQILQFVNPSYNIFTDEVEWICDIELSESKIVNILSLNNESIQRFENALLTSKLSYDNYLNVNIWSVLSKYETQVFRSSVAILNNCLLYSEDSDITIKKVLSAFLSNTGNFYDDRDLRIAYYLAVGKKKTLSLSLTKFVSIKGLNISWQLSALQYDDSKLIKTDVYILESREYAVKKFYEIKRLFFINANYAWITDKFIVAKFYYPVSELKTIIMGM
ncbi:MAG: hypothetical protein QXG12_05025 [Thermoproteota archaeon]